MAKPTTIVIPIYADWPSLRECLDSIEQTVDLKINKVILVNDCGPEADSLERDIKKWIKDKSGYEYYRNSSNLGFVGTCNRAVLELDASENNILLLNSDTKVTPGWLTKLDEVLASSPKLAAVSPRSNNASIATVPLSQAINHGIDTQQSYRIYKKIRSRLPIYYEAPVAIGFCILIRRSLIKKYGLFDRVFGKGYGEEVDFCQRLKKKGYLCAIANHAYVFHMEAKSFTSERKRKLIDEHNKIIWKRYPNYRQEVRDWMDMKVLSETAIERSLGISSEPSVGGMRGLLKKSPVLYRVARSIYRKVARF